MEELDVLAEIEYTKDLTLTPTAYEAGIWRFTFYADGGILPFMDDTYTRTTIMVNNIIIDNEEYIKFDSLEELKSGLADDRGGWVNGRSVVYVRYPYFKTAASHYLFRYGTIMGFTNGKPILLNEISYRPGLVSTPVVSHCVDTFKYDRMKFNSATVSIDNTKGNFDECSFLFGNEFNIYVGVKKEPKKTSPDYLILLSGDSAEGRLISMASKEEEYVVLRRNLESAEPYKLHKLFFQYYIDNICVTLEKVIFSLKDKRERLSSMIPNRQFTKEQLEKLGTEEKYVDDNIIDKDMQEVYGRCFGVPGVCLEGRKVYINGTSGPTITHCRFRFSSQISRVDRIQVKMTAGSTGIAQTDGWTTVYQRVKPDDGSVDDFFGWKSGLGSSPGDLETYKNSGIITLRSDIAHQAGKIDNQVNEVRMDGVFNNPENRNINNNDFVTPLDIIKDIMTTYAGIPYDKYRYHIDEIEEELLPLNHEIGIMFYNSISVFEAIEKLQSGCVQGFQFHVYEDRYTARLDNLYRKPRPESIHHLEILNLDEVEIDWNANLYGSYTNIGYKYSYSEKDGRHLIDKKSRQKVLSQHRVEKEWKVETLLTNEKDAQLKSDILLNDFSEMHPIIKNIKLQGIKWFDLRIYDVVVICFVIPGEAKDKHTQLVRIIEEAGCERVLGIHENDEEYVIIAQDKEMQGKREFAGEVLCQIVRVELDAQTGITTIDVRLDKSKNRLTSIEKEG